MLLKFKIYVICFTDMHETVKSQNRRNTTGSSYADRHRDYSRFHLASPKPAHIRKSVASTQLPSTKLGLYKALQPLLKLASPSRLDGLVLLYYVDVCCHITCVQSMLSKVGIVLAVSMCLCVCLSFCI